MQESLQWVKRADQLLYRTMFSIILWSTIMMLLTGKVSATQIPPAVWIVGGFMNGALVFGKK